MTNPSEWGSNPSGGASSTITVGKSEASEVKDTAVDAGRGVATTAKQGAADVVAETKQQAKTLLSSVSDEVRTQAGSQQQRIAAAVHALSEELGGMASSTTESSRLSDLAHQASRKGGDVAHWLEDNEPRDVLSAVTAYARRRPTTFLAICGLAGVVVGRLTRSAVAANTSLDSKQADSSTPRALVAQPDTARLPQVERTPASLVDETPTTYDDNQAGPTGYASPLLNDARTETDLMR